MPVPVPILYAPPLPRTFGAVVSTAAPVGAVPFSWTHCALCNLSLGSPAAYVEHLTSDEHANRVAETSGQKESASANVSPNTVSPTDQSEPDTQQNAAQKKHAVGVEQFGYFFSKQ